ncbi:MAG: hypothetical protein JNK72_19460 [Myxococcales bacterium]|nr:hypothetical protein [Myxococcales bacterium]
MRHSIMVLLGLLLATPRGAGAQPRRPPAAPQRPTAAAPAAATATPGRDAPMPALSSDPPDDWDLTHREAVLARIRQASLGNAADGARAIGQALLAGLEPDVAAVALDTLAALARPEGSVAVAAFLEHRRPTLRRHAVVAAQAINTRAMARRLEARLGDPDPLVRGDVAAALGEIGDLASMPPLWAALDRDLTATLTAQSPLAHNCALAIGRRGAIADVERLVGYLRRAPFASIAEAFEAALGRRDLDDALKLRIVRAVADVSTPEVQSFLTRIADGYHGRPVAWVEFARTAAGRIQ